MSAKGHLVMQEEDRWGRRERREGVPSGKFKALDGQTHEHDGVNP